MADLSSVISISVVLDKSGAGPTITIVDNSAYPLGVPQTITGTPVITQPDGIVTTAPTITWNSGALTPSVSPLRLSNSSTFQSNGNGYTIVYTVVAPGYSNTVLTKTFSFNYNPVTQILAPGLDNFTPHISVTDVTSYGQSGFTFVSVNQTWAALITNVLGGQQNIVGAGGTFDMNYLGSYYDSAYNVTLSSIITYQLPNPATFVTLVDKLVTAQTFTTEIPPTLIQLLTQLTTLKSQLDAAVNNCSPIVATLQATYTLAISIYTHLIDRGQNTQLAGLSDYVYQLQKIFNNGVQITYVNTGNVIPAYNWGGGGSTTVTWNNIQGKPSSTFMSWTVGQGGFPGAGTSTATNAGFANQQVIAFRNNLFEPVSKSSLASTTVIFTSNFVNGETIFIIGFAL